jgi:hypothetical protein
MPGEYVVGMTENPDEAGRGSEENGREDTGNEDTGREDTELSTKLDPDFIPQQGDTPEAQRAREHPEETGS